MSKIYIISREYFIIKCFFTKDCVSGSFCAVTDQEVSTDNPEIAQIVVKQFKTYKMAFPFDYGGHSSSKW